MQTKSGVKNEFAPSLHVTVIGLVEATEQADGGHPAVHVLLGLGHQVPDPLLRLQVEDEAALQLLLRERQACVHLTEEGKKRIADKP